MHSVGSNVYGQLGIGDRTVEYQFELRMVEGRLCGRRCVSVGTGTHVSFVVTDQGLISIRYIAICIVSFIFCAQKKRTFFVLLHSSYRQERSYR